jgi:hypothetical protein
MAFWRSRRRSPLNLNAPFESSARREKKQAKLRREAKYEQFEPRRMMAVSPKLISIIPNEGELLVDGQTRDVAPRELTFRFSEGQIIDPTTLGGVQIVRSGFDGVIGNGNDVFITPGYIGIGDRSNEVVARFADALPDDLYQIRIVGAGTTALRNTEGDAFNDGVDVTVRFEMDLGAQVIAVVPQPVTRLANGSLSQARNQIEVYFNNDDLNVASAQNPNFYQLIFTASTGNNQDDVVYKPSSVIYDAAQDKALLTFATDITSLGSGQGVYRLRIGNADPIPTAPNVTQTTVDQGSTFATAQNIGPLANQSKVIKAAVDPQLFRLELPGDLSEPGHRQSTQQEHFLAERQPDSTVGTTTAYYNFKNDYGVDPFGNPLFNTITEVQKQRVREIFSLYSYYAGIQFIESADRGMTIVTGDPRALDPTVAAGPGGVLGIAGGGLVGTAIMDRGEDWGASEFGGEWFNVAMHEIGHLLGLGHSDELAPLTLMSGIYDPTVDAEKVFPGDHDIVHLRYLYRPEVKDIDVYRFSVAEAGTIIADIMAERLPEASELDSLVSIYDSSGKLIARNDDYVGNDSLVQIEVPAGDYFVVVSSSGNNEYNLNVEDSGFEGVTQGNYSLKLDFTPKPTTGMVDSTGTLFDGDADGAPGGAYNFWFQVATAENTVFVDKAATTAVGALGSIGNPFRNLRDATDPNNANSARAGDVLRVIGNGGTDGNLATVADNMAYEVGFNSLGSALSDGSTLRVPKGVSMMVDAGAIFKLRRANIDVGSFSLNVDRSLGSMQVLGTPKQSVYFTSYHNEQLGRDTFALPTTPDEGDWGGLVFRNEFDYDAERSVLETEGIFLNYVNHAEITYGGGDVLFDSRQTSFSPIHLVESRPTITYNSIRLSADSAISADPDSFADNRFYSDLYTADYDRVGPEVQSNRLSNNTINGLFVRIETETLSGEPLDKLNLPGRFDDTDIVHVVAENLLIRGNPGGRILVQDQETGDERNVSRPDARLKIDPGIVVKLDGSRIETELGADFIAEGRARNRIIFTSLSDDRFGGSGSFDTGGEDPLAVPEPGDWGGLYFGATSDASIDHALITYAGGIIAIDGDFAGFNPIEIHQAKVRVANSILELNDDGFGGADRLGMTENGEAAIYVSGAQPILVNNIIRHNAGPALNINVNSLNSIHTTDWGRNTGAIDIFTGVIDNFGPLVRGNLLANNDTNGMVVRGATLTTQSVWDDTDIVHVLLDEVIVDNHHTFSGLRLQSTRNESLVIKLLGDEAGFTATGLALDIDDRIGGSVYVLGTAGKPVVFASLNDDSVGAGLDPDGNVILDTNNDGILSSPEAGDWRSVKLDRYSNDRNVDVINEEEPSVGPGSNINGNPEAAQPLGELATSELSGDDNRRLGFEVHGFLNSIAPGDVDVYSFRAMAGTEVWIDLDRTAHAMDAIVELIDADGVVLARSDNSVDEFQDTSKLVGAARLMQRDVFSGRDQYGTNPRDAGMRAVLPGPVSNVPKTYFVRVRARGQDVNNLTGGRSMGEYQLQVRLREADEIAGSTVRYADIRHSTNGIEVIGMPTRSPLLGDVAEINDLTLPNGVRANAQDIGNLLAADLGIIDVAGNLRELEDPADPGDPTGELDVDWYKFQLSFALTQSSSGFLSTLFDIDYADGLARPDTTLALFDENGHLIMIARDSNVTDDQPNAAAGSSVSETTRGSFGKLDPYAGPYGIPATSGVADPNGVVPTYYLAVMSNKELPAVLNAFYQVDALNAAVRMEPLGETVRVAEDRIGTQGGTAATDPATVLFPGTSPIQLSANADTLFLNDVSTWIVDGSDMFTIDPYSGAVESDVTGVGVLLPEADVAPQYTYADMGMRNDGRLFTIANPADPDETPKLREINPVDGTTGLDYDIELPELYAWGLNDEGEEEYTQLDGATIQFEAMAWAPGEQPRTRLLYAIGNIPGYEDLLPELANPDNPNPDPEFYPNLFFRIAGDEFFGNSPPGSILGLPQDPVEAEPFDGSVHLNTQVDGEDGGIITGMAIVPVLVDGILEDRMYAVTDLGHMFEIEDFDGPEPLATYMVTLSSPFTGADFEFAGMTGGPQNAENGSLASVLFATTTAGEIVAIGPEGDLLPIFRDGSPVTISQPATGIAFSRFDFNLWHVTNLRANEAGHGIDGQLGSTVERAESPGGMSFYFGIEDPRLPTTITPQPVVGSMIVTNDQLYNTYDVPGGAHGSLTTQVFDLSDYTAADKPTLYFNYWAQTEGAASTAADYTLMRDSFRVYATADGANWVQLATNNSFRSPSLNDLSELPNAISSTGGDYRQDPYPNQRVQELFDNETWRQARVDLGDIAGSPYAQLRFEFSTAASVDWGMDPARSLGASTYVGQAGTGGIAVSTPPGGEINDGDVFTLQALIDGVPVIQEFEFDTGFTFVPPVNAGKTIQDGEQFIIRTPDPDVVEMRFEFDRDGSVEDGFAAIRIYDWMSAGDVAKAMWDVMSVVYTGNELVDDVTGAPLVWLNGERLNMGQVITEVEQSNGAILVLRGAGPGSVTNPGADPILINEGMTREEVAVALARDISNGLSVSNERPFPIDSVPNLGSIAKADGKGAVRIFGYEVSAPGPLFVGEALAGEQVVLPVPTFSGDAPGKYYGDFANQQTNFRAQNNRFEGVYLDDIVIGFAERGELVVHADAFDQTAAVPQYPEEGQFFEEAIYGPYQLQIRLASAMVDAAGAQFDAIDTNDRLGEGMSLVAPYGDQVRDGATFQLSDGVTVATFEFDHGNGIQSGNIAIQVDGLETNLEMAVLIRRAINLQTKIKVKADTTPSQAPIVATSNKVQLYGAQGFTGSDGLENEPNDTIADAVNTGLTSATQGVWTRTGYIGDSGEFADVDMIEIQLDEGDSALIDIDVNRNASLVNVALLEALHAVLRVFDENGNIVSSDFNNMCGLSGAYVPFAPIVCPSDPTQIGAGPLLDPRSGEIQSYDPFYRFVAPHTGKFYIGVSSGGLALQNLIYDPKIARSGAGESIGFYQISISLGGSNAISLETYDTLFGDENPHRQQGQILLQGNRITEALEYGIRVDASERTLGGTPHPGAPRNLPELNTPRLAPGITIENNIIAGPDQGGILFSGDPGTDAAVVFGRIINNTVYGDADDVRGIGITVNENASPTLINNIVSQFAQGINVDATSISTVIGGTAYQGNTANAIGTGVGSFALLLDPFSPTDPPEPLFMDAQNGNFYLAPNSKAIDSSINSLQDRPFMVSIGSPLGIAPSPILAPERDAFGQLRVNDPDVPSPPGLGSNVFKDRGALDRADFAGPSAVLIVPEDNSPDGVDLDSNANSVFFVAQTVTAFSLQIVDGVLPADPQAGSGVDDTTVDASKFLLRRNGVLLTLGVDYFFSYDSLNNVARFIASQGIWTDGEYLINVENSAGNGILDVAGNVIKPNNLDGETEFVVRLATADFGDAPEPQYPTVIASQGAVHVLVPGIYLGNGVTADNDGQPSGEALGDTDDGVQFGGDLFGGQTTNITVRASVAGKLDAWIDFNRDGDWDDAGEQIFASRNVNAGLNTLGIAVPANATLGESFARFRFSTAGGLAPTGLANNGEVEDYLVEIAPPVTYSVVVSSTGGRELAKDLDGRYGVGPGSEVVIQVYVDDERSVLTGGGVRAAFADLVASNPALEFVQSSLTYGPTFSSSLSGTINTATGVVDEAGGIGSTPSGTDRQLLFSVRGKVKTNAAVGAIVDLTLNPADTAAHATKFYGSEDALPPAFESASLVVLEHPYQNPGNRFDVNADGVVSGLDALVLINRINASGPQALPIPVTSAQPPYLDPNGDNALSALDVLQVINEINRRSAALNGLSAQGESAPLLAGSSTPVFDFEAIAASLGPVVTTPAYAGAFLPTTLSPGLGTTTNDAVDLLFAEESEEEVEFATFASDDEWFDDEFSTAIAVSQPRTKAKGVDELASLWNHESQDWTRTSHQTIVEKRNAKRWG